MTGFPPQAWDHYQRHRDEIAGLLDPRCYHIDWLDNELLNTRALAFGSDSAVIVVALRAYPAGATELHGLVAAGELSGILELIDQAEEWGRAHGITFAGIASRPGWARVLKARGYETYQTELRKELH
ncbi:MAG: hypothetical protein J7500_15785 [Sphingomonas sp.]|uniref:hypothetical protein n=1 Tax=Sphingomonas sp. TaxID=28214 RepID=UPI001B2F0C89|nr:hypothetical protein [Sphingomonas sp.]MBO9624169.1 hypothetical protein [Sphingomonas sp.]